MQLLLIGEVKIQTRVAFVDVSVCGKGMGTGEGRAPGCGVHCSVGLETAGEQ